MSDDAYARTPDAFVQLVSRLGALVVEWTADSDETRMQCARELVAAIESVADHRQQS